MSYTTIDVLTNMILKVRQFYQMVIYTVSIIPPYQAGLP